MTAAGYVRAPRHSADERRAQLIAAASKRFCAVGYHSASVADVAAEVGLTARAAYRHFRTKQALLVRRDQQRSGHGAGCARPDPGGLPCAT
ncbi:TetR/AcrR family transcriptional regulator [Nocardioides marmoriginsengisoli]|uniref:TetR/AcrR family transcriptional regulator n=1 Tax=Nocardioides marmoriginsengisoli TaxID=661483 RepID=A0A3N0CHQ1_9ACTN|nr:TetR/AcrR family transcriptional regulator [Nocardioides marmoriginsengisoli]